MSIRIIVEIFDHYRDHGLTMGERDDLIVLAENANDTTRETFGPVHEPYIRRRAGNKSEQAWKNSIRALMGKKVLEPVVRGAPRRYAVYRIPVLCPDPPHDGWHGYCTRPPKEEEREEERVTRGVTHSGSSDGMGNPTGDPTEGDDLLRVIPRVEMGNPSGANGSPVGCERVTREVTPSPPPPHDPSLSSPGRAAPVPAPPADGDDEREKLIQWIKDRHRPGGKPVDNPRAYLATCEAKGDYPALLADMRADTAQQANQAPARPSLPDHCGTCGDLGAPSNPAVRNANLRRVGGPTGPKCPHCHPDMIGSVT